MISFSDFTQNINQILIQIIDDDSEYFLNHIVLFLVRLASFYVWKLVII